MFETLPESLTRWEDGSIRLTGHRIGLHIILEDYRDGGMTAEQIQALERYKYGFVTEIESETAPKGLSEETIRFISAEVRRRCSELAHSETCEPPRSPCSTPNGQRSVSGSIGRRRSRFCHQSAP